MPQSRQTTTTTTPAATASTTSTSTAAAGTQNSALADVMAGRARVDGDAATWFAQGIVLARGMKGTVIADLQKAIGAGVDGDFGPGTERALKAWQKKNGQAEDGTVDAAEWDKIRSTPAPAAAAGTGGKKPQGDEAFKKMWEAHPHNYLTDPAMGENTSSSDLNKELGFAENQFENTCALRMSTMLNRMGGEFKITKEKAIAAGLDKMRSGGLYLPQAKDPKTEATDDRVIVSAKEMWTYMEHQFGKPDMTFPPRGRVFTRKEAEQQSAAAQAACASRKGFICFDNLQLKDESGQFTGYGGSGHVDIFDGGTLSDGSYYPCQRVLVWFTV